jgi:hypothetical protein
MGRYSSVVIAACYGLIGPEIESHWGRDFPHPSRPGLGHTVSCTVRTGSLFPGVKRPGRGVNRPPPSSAEVKERVEIYLCSPSGSSWSMLGWALPLPFTTTVCFLYTAFKETARIIRLRAPVSSSLCALAQEILNGFLWNCAFYTTERHFTFLALYFLPSVLTIWRTPTVWGGKDRRCQYLSLIVVVARGYILTVGVTMVIIVTTVARLVDIRYLGN